MVVTLDDTHAAEKCVSAIRYLYPGLPIKARVSSLGEIDAMLDAGANYAVAETTEASLELGRLALAEAGLADGDIEQVMHDFRQDEYAVLKQAVVERNS